MDTQNRRRDFLKLTGFLTVSAVGTVLVGCGGGGNDRGFRWPAVPNPGAGALPGADPGDSSRPLSPAGTYAFPNGIASGDPKPNSIVLWTRVAKAQGAAGDEDLDIIVQVATKAFDDPLFSTADVIVAHPIAIHARFNHTVHHRVEGLDAGRHYWYRFVIDNDTSIQGRTKTAPAADSTTPLKFAYLSCQDWSANHWDSLRILGQPSFEDMDFIVHLGDYIYETAGEAAFQKGDSEPAHRDAPVDGALLAGRKENGARYATELADYRYLYAKYRSDARIQALHARFPLIAIWDDHEFTDDCWTDHETYTSANAQQTSRRRNANQAWFENMPVTLEDVSFAPDQANYDNIRIYRDFAFGKVMHLVMTDERLYRADHSIPEPDGMEIMQGYVGKLIDDVSNLKDPNGLYQFLKNTAVIDFGLFGKLTLEQAINDAINKGSLPFGVELPGIDLKGLKPTLLKLLNSLLATPLAETAEIKIDAVLTALSGIDTKPLLAGISSSLGFGGIGSRYAALGNVLARYVAQSQASRYGMLGPDQTQWWKAKLSAAQAAGTTWKIWGNEVCFVNMPLDINRIRNSGLQLSGALGLFGGIVTGLIGVVKYLLTTDEVRASLPRLADYTGDGSAANSKPGQLLIPFADSWDGYPSARDELTSFLAQNAIDNVVAITGDLHTFIAGQVLDRASGKPVMLDFAGAGVSSNSFGGLFGAKAGSIGTDSAVSGLKPLLTGRDLDVPVTSMLKDIVTGITSRPDKTNDGRDLFARLLMHFSDEVRWAEGLANGFATVTLDMEKAQVTYHNVRVERDAAGLVQPSAAYVTDADPDSAYERRSSFTIRARSAGSAAAAADAAVWPAFPPRVQEFENPAVAGAPVMHKLQVAAPEPAPAPASTSKHDVEKLAAGVQQYVDQNPSNPFAQVFLDSLKH